MAAAVRGRLLNQKALGVMGILGISILVFLAIALIIGFLIVQSLLPIPNSIKNFIKKELDSQGLELVIIKRPRPFHSGPFPAISFKAQPVHTKLGGVSGESSSLFIVEYRKGQETHISWVEISKVAFRISEANWKPPLPRGDA